MNFPGNRHVFVMNRRNLLCISRYIGYEVSRVLIPAELRFLTVSSLFLSVVLIDRMWRCRNKALFQYSNLARSQTVATQSAVFHLHISNRTMSTSRHAKKHNENTMRVAHITDLHWLSKSMPSPFQLLGKRIIGYDHSIGCAHYELYFMISSRIAASYQSFLLHSSILLLKPTGISTFTSWAVVTTSKMTFVRRCSTTSVNNGLM